MDRTTFETALRAEGYTVLSRDLDMRTISVATLCAYLVDPSGVTSEDRRTWLGEDAE